MDDTLGHIGLPPKKRATDQGEGGNKEADSTLEEDDPREWRPSHSDEYIGAIDKGNGWEPAVTLQDLSMEEDLETFEYLEIGGDE